jgi:DNA repair protein RecO (recombination protein O)
MTTTPVREILDEAVVLRTFKSGEADRIAVLWTKNHGKVRVVARGARKTTSKLGAGLEPLTWATVDLVATRGDLYVTRAVRTVEHLTVLRADYDRLNAGFAALEALDALVEDGAPDEAIFDVLTRVLKTLNDTAYVPALVPASFFLRLLALDGSALDASRCVACEVDGPLVSFNATAGGTLCATCRSGSRLSADAVVLLQRILGGDLAAVLREANPAGGGEIATLIHEAMEAHVGRRLKVARSAAPLPITPDR